ncbi:hypothetical protein [Streptomyces sp. NPDC048436]|uniref:hypothetical protein n=1 Tax=Streptomyces sp. NPDC048436 TaxID=3365550 RepID=UPI00371AC630
MNPRLIALLGVVAITVLLPFAGASAGPVGAGGDPDAKQPSTEKSTSEQSPVAASSEEAPLGGASPEGASPGGASPGQEAAAQCGPELTSPKGIEAQTCVLTQGDDTWARTYYRNMTGDELSAVLTVMGPGARTVQMHCAVGAEDEPGACETPRERTAGNAAAYSAVAEFADGSDGPLLLRSGSNSGHPKAS